MQFIKSFDSVVLKLKKPLPDSLVHILQCGNGLTPKNKIPPSRHQLDDTDLLMLFKWTEHIYLKNTKGSPIRRIGYEAWQRKIAVAFANAESTRAIIEPLQSKLETSAEIVNAHIEWALGQLAD